MSATQMAERCRGARQASAACLPGFRFHIASHGGATIVPDAAREVHGVLWRCTPQHLSILDRYEGVRVGAYRRRYVTVRLPCGTPVRTLTYIATRTWPGPARTNYMLTAVIPGAIAHALPDAYIAELKAWMPRIVIGERCRRYRGRKR